MPEPACPFCQAELGYYSFQGKKRCLNCYQYRPQDMESPTEAEAATTEPNRDYQDKAVGPPEPMTTAAGKTAPAAAASRPEGKQAKGKTTKGTA